MLFILTFLLLTSIQTISIIKPVESSCSRGCDLTLGSYYVWEGNNLTFISTLTSIPIQTILDYNTQIPNQDFIQYDTRITIPFSCECLENGEFLGQVFNYNGIPGDTYQKVAEEYYSNLTTADWLQRSNSYPADDIFLRRDSLNVTVNCSCGDENIDKRYGLFVTYPLRVGDSLESIAAAANLSPDLIRSYNQGVNFSAGSGLVYFPVRDRDGSYRPLNTSTEFSSGAIAGISVAVIVGLMLFSGCLYVYYTNKAKKVSLLSKASEDQCNREAHDGRGTIVKAANSNVPHDGGLTGITVDKSVEFTYEELAKATDDFNIANKIGEGGFASVYYAELRGEKAAIKKMDMKATREFLAELKVLTHVLHLNLVRLIGYCVEGSLFLVYEYIENGNLSQHLHGSGKDPLPWSTRLQIALDAARGLEYIHEHTVPVYIHRDIKSTNILIGKNFQGKVADFGLTKVTESGGKSLPTRLVGTFGYMSPEYARYGRVSPKVDVYAFGVVLYELISAKEAVVLLPNGSSMEAKALVALFEEALSQSDPKDNLSRLMDPRLEDDYPLDSVFTLAQLANACTDENPQLRPSMRSIVVALRTLSSSTEDWDFSTYGE